MPHYDSRITATVAPLERGSTGSGRSVRPGEVDGSAFPRTSRRRAAVRFTRRSGREARWPLRHEVRAGVISPWRSSAPENPPESREPSSRRPATSAGSLVPSKAVDCGSPASTERTPSSSTRPRTRKARSTATSGRATTGTRSGGEARSERVRCRTDSTRRTGETGSARPAPLPDLDGVEHSLGEVAFSARRS